jgi:hypothetical protein
MRDLRRRPGHGLAEKATQLSAKRVGGIETPLSGADCFEPAQGAAEPQSM